MCSCTLEDAIKERIMTIVKTDNLGKTNERPRAMRRVFRFTMIELLVCISIILILVAMLMPALSRVRYKATRVACMNNFKQCGIAFSMYAEKFSGRLANQFGGHMNSSVYRMDTTDLDLVTSYDDYISDWKVWGCPAVNAPAPDDPANIRWACYSSYMYFPGDDYPKFGTPSSNMPVPVKFSKVEKPSGTPIMQDNTYRRTDGLFNTTHATSYVDKLTNSENPSGAAYRSWRPDGANILYYDGHVSWVPFSQMKSAGICNPGSTTEVYSYWE